MSDEIDRYEAPAFCENCKYEGPVMPKVGKKVHTELCPVCRALHVMPANAPIAERWRSYLEDKREK